MCDNDWPRFSIIPLTDNNSLSSLTLSARSHLRVPGLISLDVGAERGGTEIIGAEGDEVGRRQDSENFRRY